MATTYPPELTEVEQVELSSALSFHFEASPTCRDDLEPQFDVLCAVVTRIIRRRNEAS